MWQKKKQQRKEMSGDINVSLHTCGVKCYEQCMVEIKLLR